MNGKSRSPTVRRPQSQGRSQRAVNQLWFEELEPRLLLSADLAGGLGADGAWQLEDPRAAGAEVELLTPAVDMSNHETDRGTDGLEPDSLLRSTAVLPPPLAGVAAEDAVQSLRLGPAPGAMGNTGYLPAETHSTGLEEPSQRDPGPAAPIPPDQASGPLRDVDPPDERATSGHGLRGGPFDLAADAPRFQAGDTPELSKQSALRLADRADAPLPGELAPTDASARGPGTGPDDTPGHRLSSGGSPTPPGTGQPGTEQPGTEPPGMEQPRTGQPGTEPPGMEQPGPERPGPWASRPADSPEPGEGDPKSGQSPGPQPPPFAGEGGQEELAFEDSTGEGLRPGSDWANDAEPERAQAAEPLESQRHMTGAPGSPRPVQDHPSTWSQGFDLQRLSAGDDTIEYPGSSEAPIAEPESPGVEAIPHGKVSMAMFGMVGVEALGLSTGVARWAVRVWTLLGSLLSSIPLWKRAKAYPVLRMGVRRHATPGRGVQAPANGVRPETGEEIDLLFDSKKAP